MNRTEAIISALSMRVAVNTAGRLFSVKVGDFHSATEADHRMKALAAIIEAEVERAAFYRKGMTDGTIVDARTRPRALGITEETLKPPLDPDPWAFVEQVAEGQYGGSADTCLRRRAAELLQKRPPSPHPRKEQP